MTIQFTQEVISNIWTASLLRNSIINKLVSIGFLQEGALNDDIFFSYDLPTSAPKDKGFLRMNVTNTTANNIRNQLYFSDSYSNNALVNPVICYNDSLSGSANIAYTAGESFPIKFCTFKSSEVALLAFQRNDNTSGLTTVGFIMPSIRPTWWDNNSVYGFAPGDAICNSLRSYSTNPMFTVAAPIIFGHTPSQVNPGGTRDLLRRVILQVAGHGFIVGATNTDIGLLGASGLLYLSQIQDQGQTWLGIGGNTSLAFRIG